MKHYACRQALSYHLLRRPHRYLDGPGTALLTWSEEDCVVCEQQLVLSALIGGAQGEAKLLLCTGVRQQMVQRIHKGIRPGTGI